MNHILNVRRFPGGFGQHHLLDETLHKSHDVKVTNVALASTCETNTENIIAHTDNREIKPEYYEQLAAQYPESEFDAVLVHVFNVFEALYENNLYEKTRLCYGAHTVLRAGQRRKKWYEMLNNRGNIYIFVGSVRSGRTFIPHDRVDACVLIAPIMGREFGSPGGPLSKGHIKSPELKYDIGFYSSKTLRKRPHRVLITASNVAEKLGRELDVWISGREKFTSEQTDKYIKLFNTVSDCYDNVNLVYSDILGGKRLAEYVQQTRAIYLPIANRKETTCYSAWESVALDVPLIVGDIAGAGEAARTSDHPLTRAVPLSVNYDLFDDTSRNLCPELVESISNIYEGQNMRGNPLTIDEQKAQEALVNAITNRESVSYSRSPSIPRAVRVDTTYNALSDVASGMIPSTLSRKIDDGLVEKKAAGVVQTNRGYKILASPPHNSVEVVQSGRYGGAVEQFE